jgi:F-type H+-transporting ATPase subunit epsilon
MENFYLEIVSPEAQLFVGRAQKLFLTGVLGELEILSGHTPLLTALEPGPVWIVKDNGDEEGLVIFGGMLEVLPDITIVLADAALRAKDIDEAAAKEAKKVSENAIFNSGNGLNYAKVHADLNIALAQLKIVRKIKSLRK